MFDLLWLCYQAINKFYTKIEQNRNTKLLFMFDLFKLVFRPVKEASLFTAFYVKHLYHNSVEFI